MARDYRDVNKLYRNLSTHYNQTQRQIREADRMSLQEFEGLIDVPYEVQIFKSATAANIVNGFRNQIHTDEPTVDFRASGPSVAAGKHGTLMQKWGYSQLRKERLFGVMDPNLQCGADLILRGAACKKITVDVDQMMEAPPRKGTKAYAIWEHRAMRTWPFMSRAIDPLSIFPPPGQRKPLTYMIERQVRFAGEVQDMYPDWINPDKKENPTRRLEWLEYWDEEQYIRVADARPVQDDDENPYHIVPYIFEWSGMGRSHNDGDPSHLAVGLLTDIIGELEQEVRLKTIISVQTQMHVFPPILTVDDPKKVAKQFGVGPGKVIRHPPGHPPVYMEFPPPNDNFYRFLDTIQQNIARVHSQALSGGRDPGVSSGIFQAELIGQALSVIKPIRGSLNVIGTQTLNMMAFLAHELDLHMVIEGAGEPDEPAEATQRVEGKDFTHLNFDVSFEAVDPAENDRAMLVGEALRRSGDISRRTFWMKYAKKVVEDPDEEEIRLLAESVLDRLAESGELGLAVLSAEVQEQMQQQAAEAQGRAQEVVQNRVADTVPQAAAANARELEQISGTPGSQVIPRDVAEQGMASASPSTTGLPG